MTALSDTLPPGITLISHTVQVHKHLLMDAGLISDTRPPAPPASRGDRLRWWRQRQRDRVADVRWHLAAWISPWPIGEREGW